MKDLEKQLIDASKQGARHKLIVTDGVFSMDGLLAPLDAICDLADKYDATAKKEIIEILRQRSRPYLFSNSLAPGIVGASIKVFDLLENDNTLRNKLKENTSYFKQEMQKAGFDIIDGEAAIVPVMLYDAKLSQNMADALLEEGIYVIGFFYPVVPKEKARIRVQLSAAHTKEHLDKAIQAFIKVGKALEVL